MKCVVCDAVDQWEQVDKDNSLPPGAFKAKHPDKAKVRLKEVGMSICKSCGFISYPNKWKSEEELKEYYRAEYRPAPKVQNWYSGQRKLHYHNAFLRELCKEWKETGKTKPVIGEIGAAYGLFLNFMREKFPEADVSGTELTLSYKRNAYHEFGIELTEDFDYSKKYDLIASYKVAEHQFDIDVLLRKYVECLNEGGKMYISVPIWFDKLNNFGAGGFDLEYYYHPNHINVWTKDMFETILRKAGLKIIKFNDTMYDNTYLCERDDSLMSSEKKFEGCEVIKKHLSAVYQAGTHFMEGRFEEAIAVWPNFPEAHGANYEKNRAQNHQNGFQGLLEKIVGPAIAMTRQSPEAFCMAGDLLMRYDKWLEAISMFERVLSLKPGYAPALKGVSQSLRQLGHRCIRERKDQEAVKYLHKAREATRFLAEVSAQDQPEAISWVYDDNSRIPTPAEIESGVVVIAPV